MDNYQISINNVLSVYSGKNGFCCCGCAGKHTYAKKYQRIASRDRGYRVNDDEVSDRTVKTIVNKMNKLFAIPGNKPEYEDDLKNFASIVKGERLYIAYFKKVKKIKSKNRGNFIGRSTEK